MEKEKEQAKEALIKGIHKNAELEGEQTESEEKQNSKKSISHK